MYKKNYNPASVDAAVCNYLDSQTTVADLGILLSAPCFAGVYSGKAKNLLTKILTHHPKYAMLFTEDCLGEVLRRRHWGQVIQSAILRLTASNPVVSVKELYDEPGMAALTKEKFHELVSWTIGQDKTSSLITKVLGVMPPTINVIEHLESVHGRIDNTNFLTINEACVAYTKMHYKPFLEFQLKEQLEAATDHSLGKISLTKDAFLDLCIGPVDSGITSFKNAIVTRAGSLNEHIFRLGLINSGLVKDLQVHKTGKKGLGDLACITDAKRLKKELYVEIKSFKAKERLHRGLTDIETPWKVGVGFFDDEREFSKAMTTTYCQTKAAAIYIPDKIFKKIDPALRVVQANESELVKGKALYRPLSSFIDDMKHFVEKGSLP